MIDLHSNAFWQKCRESARKYLAKQPGCSVEEAVTQAIRLKEWTKKEMERINKRRY
jgi:hypothetical protein